MSELQQAVIVPVRSKYSRLFRLEKDYSFTWDLEGTPNRITIFSGFMFDLSSIPRIGYLVIKPVDDANMISPSLVHDALYRTGGTFLLGKYEIGKHEYFDNDEWKPVIGVWSKEDADRLFKKMIRLYSPSTPKWKVNLIYNAVKFFGKRAFKKAP